MSRVARILIGEPYACAPMLTMTTGLLMTGAAVASVTYPLGIVLMVEAVAHNSSSGELAGGILVAALFWASWAMMVAGATQASALTDRLLIQFTTKIASLINAVGGISHLERPEHLAHVDQLEQQRRTLAMGPQHALVLLQVAIRTTIICALLASVYAPLALLALAGLPPLLADRRATATTDAFELRVAEKKRLAAALFSLASGAGPAKELRVFGLRRELAARHVRLNDEMTHAAHAAAIRAGLWSAVGWSTYGLSFAGAIAVIAVRAANGEARTGQVVLAVALLRRAQLAISQVSDTLRKLLSSATIADHMLWLEDYAAFEHANGARVVSGRSRGPVATPPPVPSRLEGGVQLVDLSFSYPGTDVRVLDELNVDLCAGQSVAIVGENGAGKSTLVKLLTGMYRPSEGLVLVDGVDLRSLNLSEWRSRCSAVFQDFIRYDLTVGDNVGVGDLPRRTDIHSIETALAHAGGPDALAQLPAGVNTPLGWSFDGGRELSAGQWQKLALGRGMMRESPLLLVLDEPTGSLDAPTEHALFGRYLEHARRTASANGAITVLVSHRFSTVRAVDLIVVVAGGRAVERGNHVELMAVGGIYAEMFDLQARAYR